MGGFHTEYSSLRFALFYLAEFMNTITMSAIMVTLFFGGPDGPGFHFVRWLWPILWFVGKTVVFLYVYVWIRAALPRLRYDQLMDLGWKVLIPFSLGWLLVVAAFRSRNGLGLRRLRRLRRRRQPGSGRRSGSPRVRREALEDRSGRARRDRPRPSDPHLRAVPEPDGGGVMARKPREEEVARVLRRLRRHLEAGRRAEGHHALSGREGAPSPPGCTVATSSTATRTGWRSASAASCARPCARPTASTCAASTTRPMPRCRPGSGTASSTRSTTCAASTATCASRRARPRRSPSRRCSSSPSRTAPTPSTPRRELVVDDDGRPRHLPWEDWRPGEDEHTSGWMRATSPSGAVEYEGDVQWSGELGYGVRPPEGGQSDSRNDVGHGEHLHPHRRAGQDLAALRGQGARDVTNLLAAATIPDAITFAIAAAICVVGAFGVVLARNPVHSALMLVMTLFGVAVLFVEENAQFLAAVQVIVYAGAIVVLFLFVIMLLGVDRSEAIEPRPAPGPAASSPSASGFSDSSRCSCSPGASGRRGRDR